MLLPTPSSFATCRCTSSLPLVLALTHLHLHKSSCVRQPFAEISGNTVSSSPVVPLPETVPIFVCQFKGSLHCLSSLCLSVNGRRGLYGRLSVPDRRLPAYQEDMGEGSALHLWVTATAG